jgi:hypothetical protein
MPTMRKTDVVKMAMTGLIGDNQKTIVADKLYKRVMDQCHRLGVYVPAWPVFVDAVRANKGSFFLRQSRSIVRLPARGKLGKR